MKIGGLAKLSLLDYPGHLSAIIFTTGCNFRCRFCYNPMLVLPGRTIDKSQAPSPSEEELEAFLTARRGKLEAVVVTGGEPTIHADLPKFLAKIKKLGYLIKLDTNGTNPEMLADLLKNKLVDYLAMDLKAPTDKYEQVTGVKVDLNKIKKSVKLIIDSGLPYEFRTTVVKSLMSEADIKAMAEILRRADFWYLQKFEGNRDLVDAALVNERPYTDQEMTALAAAGATICPGCRYRQYYG